MTTRRRPGPRWRRLFLLPTGNRRQRRARAAATAAVPSAPLYPPRPAYPPRPLQPPPTRPALTGRRGSDGASSTSAPVIKITAMETPATGTPIHRMPATEGEHGVSARLVPRKPEQSPDEFLMTEGWQRFFDAAIRREDVVEFTVRQGSGATVRVSETTIEIPKILAQPTRVAHLCRCCWTLASGDQLTGQLWRCDECRQIAAY